MAVEVMGEMDPSIDTTYVHRSFSSPSCSSSGETMNSPQEEMRLQECVLPPSVSGDPAPRRQGGRNQRGDSSATLTQAMLKALQIPYHQKHSSRLNKDNKESPPVQDGPWRSLDAHDRRGIPGYVLKDLTGLLDV